MPVNFDFGDSLSGHASVPTSKFEIVKNASVANGGERIDNVDCIKCNGSGMTRWGRCFRCDGKGRITKRSAAASKGAQTARENLREKQARTYASPEWAYISKRAAKGSAFYASFIEKVETYGALTENQLAVVHKDMAKDAAFYEARNAERAAVAPTIEMSNIEKMFAVASQNKKNPKFYVGDMVISPAKATGRNPGAIYVKVAGEYAGKIVSGRFFATQAAPAGTAERINELAADPREAARKWGKEEVRCCCCGIELTDPVSKENGIGPICAENWGL